MTNGPLHRSHAIAGLPRGIDGFAPDRGSVSLFPGESRDAVAISQEGLCELSFFYSDLYLVLVDVLASALSERFGVSRVAAAMITREAIVPLTHFFMDRLLRLSMAGERKVLLPRGGVPGSLYPDDLDEFTSCAPWSAELNQKIICELAPLLKVEIERPLSPRDATPLPPAVPTGSFVNHNFGGRTLCRKIRNRFVREYQKRFDSCRGRIPVLSMAYAGSAFAAHEFYSEYFFDIRGRLRLENSTRTEALRASFFLAIVHGARRALLKFLDDSGTLRRVASDSVLEAFATYLAAAYPSSHLEAMPQNLSNAIGLLEPMGAPAVINTEVNNTEATYIQAAAKALGMKTIGCQHGGHYGYLDDHTRVWEMEYSYFDYFVTWGWTEMPRLAVCRTTQAIPLPSPWLSERRVYLKKSMVEQAAVSDAGRYDFLLMTNKIYRFPPAPSGAAISRSDRLPEISAYLSNLVSECARQDIRVLHKPYNERTVRQYADLFAELDRLGGKCHARLETFHKGLSPDLLRRCHVVLWDQPGTGFLECLACDIPTMIFWPRVYNHETPLARPAFAALEAAGIVHVTTSSLLAEYRRFQSSPGAWVKMPARVDAIVSFRQQYGWADAQWPDKWRQFLDRVLDGTLG